MENLKERLKAGEVVSFDNSKANPDDHRTAECSFRDSSSNIWANGFKIDFNGELLISTKCFKTFNRRLDKLKEKWNLEPQA